MSYFTALLGHSGDRYRLLDMTPESADALTDLADYADSSGYAEDGAVAVVEHEDEWFALMRFDDGDATVFISDADAAAASPFADLFADYLDAADDEYEDEVEPAEEEPEDSEDDEDEPQMLEYEQAPKWVGDAAVFADAGIGAEELLDQLEKHSSDPARVVAHVGEAVGFADALEGAR